MALFASSEPREQMRPLRTSIEPIGSVVSEASQLGLGTNWKHSLENGFSLSIEACPFVSRGRCKKAIFIGRIRPDAHGVW